MKAFPIIIDRETQIANDTNFAVQESGMDLRDYFAAKCLQGLLSCSEVDGTKEFLSNLAYEYADAMMDARE